MRKLKNLIDEHRKILLTLKAEPNKNEPGTTENSEGSTDESFSGSSSENEPEITENSEGLIDESFFESRLDYLTDLESSLESGTIHIIYPDEIYMDEGDEKFISYQIKRFNSNLLKLIKPFAKEITFSHPGPSVFDIYEILENNNVVHSIVIDAEYFSSGLLFNTLFIEAINSATNFYRLHAAIGEQGEFDEVDEVEVCAFLTGKIDKNKALLIEWTSGIAFVKEAGKEEVCAYTYEDNVFSDSEEEKVEKEVALANFQSLRV